jgi:DNA primase
MDFYEIKNRLSIEEVLNRYGIQNLKKTGNSLYGPCPIHHGDNPTAFRVSLDKNLWHCFTHCGGGSVIDFIMQMEGLNKHEAFKKAEEWINNNKDYEKKIIKETVQIDENVQKNPPLEFRLTLDPNHSYLKKRRIKPETAKYFGIGYCKSGLFKGRIAIPIHDEKGQLVAYCGRAIDDKEPKYKFPKGFIKNLVVYNLHRVKESKGKEILLVEGYFDVFRLYQADYTAIALMGSSISKAQEQLILSLDKQLILLFDGDKAGRQATKKAIKIFKGKVPLKVKYLPQGIQPDNLKEHELKKLLA